MPISSIREQPISDPSIKGQGLRKIDEEKLKKACTEFESIFIQSLLKSMRQTVPKGTFLDGGPGKGLFESMFDQELSKHLATKGGVGLGKMMYENLMRHPRMSFSTRSAVFTEVEDHQPKSIPSE